MYAATWYAEKALQKMKDHMPMCGYSKEGCRIFREEFMTLINSANAVGQLAETSMLRELDARLGPNEKVTFRSDRAGNIVGVKVQNKQNNGHSGYDTQNPIVALIAALTGQPSGRRDRMPAGSVDPAQYLSLSNTGGRRVPGLFDFDDEVSLHDVFEFMGISSDRGPASVPQGLADLLQRAFGPGVKIEFVDFRGFRPVGSPLSHDPATRY